MRPTPAKPKLTQKTPAQAEQEGKEAHKNSDYVECPYHYIEERELYKAWWYGYWGEIDKSKALGRAFR